MGDRGREVGASPSKFEAWIEVVTANDSKNGKNFMDVTETQDLGAYHKLSASSKKQSSFPSKIAYEKELSPLLDNLSKSNMEANLVTFSGFHTRYYKSEYGAKSSQWLLENVRGVIKEAGADKYGVHAEHFKHPWGQNSIIATIPGRSTLRLWLVLTKIASIFGSHQFYLRRVRMMTEVELLPSLKLYVYF